MPLLDEAALQRQAMLRQMTPPAIESASSGHEIRWGPYAALEGGQGADIATTVIALRRGGMREANPIGIGGILASKAALMALGPILMRKLAANGHPTLAKWMGYGVGAAGAIPAAMNLRTMGKTR